MSIKIISAFYGSNVHQLIEVTDTVQSFIDQRKEMNEVSLNVKAENLGLAFLYKKEEIGSLRVYYRYTEDNIIRVKTAVDGNDIVFQMNKLKHIQNDIQFKQEQRFSQNITHLMNNYVSEKDDFSSKTIENSFKSYFFFEHDLN